MYPIIILGMHRSGTSMMCKMLSELGLFVGEDTTEVNHESVFFVQINRWIFNQSGASWDNPLPVINFLSCEKTKKLAREYINNLVLSKYAASFLGKRYLRKKGISGIDFPWGWKDPRNTFTVPFWAEIFPNAKIIDMRRNGIDVASSLKVRQEKYIQEILERSKTGYFEPRYRIGKSKLDYRKMRNISSSLRCSTLEGGFELWEEYTKEAQDHVTKFGDRAIEINYEKFLEEPFPSLRILAEFCGLNVTDDQIVSVSSKIKKSRANSYLNDPILYEFARKVSDRLARFGY